MRVKDPPRSFLQECDSKDVVRVAAQECDSKWVAERVDSNSTRPHLVRVTCFAFFWLRPVLRATASI
jgi:hypothetical protein